ncbi:hypothetical protein ES703_35418 [subsurface metagenome]
MAVDMADLRMKVENEIKSCLGMGGTRVLDLNTMNCYHMGFCDRNGKPLSAQRESNQRRLRLSSYAWLALQRMKDRNVPTETIRMWHIHQG